MNRRRTGFVTDDRFFLARTDEGLGPWVEPGPAFETPEGKRRILDLLHASGLLPALVPLPLLPLSDADLLRFHTPEYVASLPGLTTWFGPGAGDLARLSAGGTAAAVVAVVRGEVDNAFALVRPPGHHGLRDQPMGYCLLGNIPLAVLKVRAEEGVGRVAVVDWDVHHGNGTEQAFAADPDVLTISVHQERLFPQDTGLAEDVGEAEGRGATVNVPLPAGSGRGAYLDAWTRVVEPAVRRFRPELIVVANGFDASSFDPLGRMMLSAAMFGELTRRMTALADELCGGRLVLNHEGGYSELHAPFCGLRVVEELSGVHTGVEDPFAHVDDYAAQALTPHQAAAVDRVVGIHGLGGPP